MCFLARNRILSIMSLPLLNQRRESIVWSHMTRHGDKAVCNLCNRTIELGKHASTSNALRHLRKNHHIDMTEPEAILKYKKVKRTLARLVILELLPLKVIKSPTIRELVHIMEPTFCMPSYYSVMKQLNVIRRNVKESVCIMSLFHEC